MAKTSLVVKPKTTAAPAKAGGAKVTNNGSVVDYIKSTGGDASFTARAQQAVNLGIVKTTGQYTGSAEQNISLLTKLQSGAKSTPTAVNDTNTAASFINGAQDSDMAAATEADAPPKRNTASEDLLANFFKQTGTKSLIPDSDFEAPNFTKLYEDKRKELGVAGLEESINEYDAMEQEIRTRLRERVDAEEGKTVSMNVISGRIGEAEKQEFRRLDEIGRAKTRAINQLQNANNTIETLMNLGKMDYEVAKGEYDTKFNQNIQLFSVFKGLSDLDTAQEDKEVDAARSNLQIMYGAIKDGGIDINALEPGMESKMTSLELKAGLPIGFYKSVAKSNPEGKVLSTTTRTSGGIKYADVILQNKDGSFSTQQIKLGADSTGSGGGSATKLTEAELSRQARSEIANALNTRRGADGYVSNEDYKIARNKWVSAGFSATDFNESFAREYVNPNFPEAYGVSLDLII